MSDMKNIFENPEEEKQALTEKDAAGQDTGVEAKPDNELNEITEPMSEAKVRHDTVK